MVGQTALRHFKWFALVSQAKVPKLIGQVRPEPSGLLFVCLFVCLFGWSATEESVEGSK